MEELIVKFNENKILMDQWKKSQKESEKVVTKKKTNKFNKEDTHIVT